jgi:hypothetical protein
MLLDNFIAGFEGGVNECISLLPLVRSPPYTIKTYLTSVAPIVTAAFLAFAYTLFFNRRTARNDILKDFQADLEEIEELSTRYWLGDYSVTESCLQLQTLGYQLRAKLSASMEYREAHTYALPEKKRSAYTSLDNKLFLKATGGSFQTSKMEASPETHNEIINIIYQMKVITRNSRLRWWFW